MCCQPVVRYSCAIDAARGPPGVLWGLNHVTTRLTHIALCPMFKCRLREPHFGFAQDWAQQRAYCAAGWFSNLRRRLRLPTGRMERDDTAQILCCARPCCSSSGCEPDLFFFARPDGRSYINLAGNASVGECPPARVGLVRGERASDPYCYLSALRV